MDTTPVPAMRRPRALEEPTDERALAVLRSYYRADDTLDAGVAYTGALFDTWTRPVGDAGGAGNSGDDPSHDRFVADDLLAVTFLSVQVPPRSAALLLDQRAAHFDGLLAAVGPDRDLVEVEDGEIGPAWPAWRLHAELANTLPGVGPVIAGKLLARKRPRLAPMLDRLVWEVTGRPNHFWDALRVELRRDGRALHERLLRLRDRAGLPPQVSALRVFDVVAWMQGRHPAP